MKNLFRRKVILAVQSMESKDTPSGRGFITKTFWVHKLECGHQVKRRLRFMFITCKECKGE